MLQMYTKVKNLTNQYSNKNEVSYKRKKKKKTSGRRRFNDLVIVFLKTSYWIIRIISPLLPVLGSNDGSFDC